MGKPTFNCDSKAKISPTIYHVEMCVFAVAATFVILVRLIGGQIGIGAGGEYFFVVGSEGEQRRLLNRNLIPGLIGTMLLFLSLFSNLILLNDATTAVEYRRPFDPARYADQLNLNISAEHLLYYYLFETYNHYMRPRVNSSEVVSVSMAYSLMQINSLNEKRQELVTTGYLSIQWTDDFLQWEPQQFGGLKKVVILPEKVWLPDIGVDNSAQAIYDKTHRTEFRVIVLYDGVVLWVPGGKFSTSCTLDITFYPYDEQQCDLFFTNWAFSGLKVNLTNTADIIDLTDYTESGEWEVMKTTSMRGDRIYGKEPFPYVRFVLYLRRKYLFHILNILVPCTLMSALILLVYWLPPECGEKISLGITVLLSFSVFLLMVAENLPQTSDSLPIIGMYLTFFMFSSSSSILINVLVLNLHHSGNERPVPPWVRRLTYGLLANMICFKFSRQECKFCRTRNVKTVPARPVTTSSKATVAAANNGVTPVDDDLDLSPVHVCNDQRTRKLASQTVDEKILYNLDVITRRTADDEIANSGASSSYIKNPSKPIKIQSKKPTLSVAIFLKGLTTRECTNQTGILTVYAF